MSVFMDETSPELDADLLEDLEFVRERIRSLGSDVEGREARWYLKHAAQHVDQAMRQVVERNIQDSSRLVDVLRRFGVQSGLIQKVIERTRGDDE